MNDIEIQRVIRALQDQIADQALQIAILTARLAEASVEAGE